MLRVCGKGHRYRGRRCPECSRERDRRRGPASRRGYGAEHRREGDAAIEAEPWCHGTPVRPCPYPDAGTPANPLTRGHIVAVSKGGGGGYVAQCLRCNSGQRDRHG